ncbi:hypothetical protein HUG17_3003 [Dermatophagoides farinae]|uniref:Transmembrane protein n=1 Tax=Dermatophagoides farinae TaxID=6954 RepID=A0A9D4NTK0_DERFA|nr:hypothetical protein HUG17_3003 [Dermatophagoides farinae]
MSSTSLLRSFRWQQISLPQNTTARRLIIFGPPLILGSLYLCKQIYLYLKFGRKKRLNIDSGNVYDTFDHSQVTTPGTNTTTVTNNSISINHSSSDNADGCVISTTGDHHHHSSSIIIKYVRHYFQINVHIVVNLSTTQLIKVSLDKLNNVTRTLDEMKMKQNILKNINMIHQILIQESMIYMKNLNQ